jgi:amino acid transporter
LLFGDWGTSRLYVLGLAFLVAGHSSFYLIGAMSLLIMAVGWAYTHICRIYPDGGGVYTAAKQRSRLLAVIGALLLFADYTVTASLSALDAFHYFGLGHQHTAQVANVDAGDRVIIKHEETTEEATEPLWSWRSPGLWAIVSIGLVGAFNLMGPKHTAGFAVFTAAGMVAITLLLTVCAIPKIHWSQVNLGTPFQHPMAMWQGFVGIVLALSGVEAIANLTGVMKQPVFKTARKSIWTVALEVAGFNLFLAVAMVAITPLAREGHVEDMLAYMAWYYVGPWGEWPVRIVGGLLLLSATNTAVNGLMSITYVMSRDGELPGVFQKLNGFGSPWVGAIIAAGVPALVLMFAHKLETLASLYAIGVIGAVAINITLCSIHPRLRKMWRRVPMFAIGILLAFIEITLAYTKPKALLFASIVMAIGLILRQITRMASARRPKPSLLRQAIIEQLPPDALAKPRFLLATAGSARLAGPALRFARDANAALVVCFVRDVALSYKVEAEARLTLDSDTAAQTLFRDFLEHGHRMNVPIIPMYDSGTSAAEIIAETAAMNGVEKILIGTSRRGSLHQFIKGSFQQNLENLLPPELGVTVISSDPEATAPVSTSSH